MIHQLEMTLTAGKPEVNEWEVGLLVILLEDIGGWATGAELVERIGMPATESSKRIIRAMAEASGGAIISGQLGYKATVHASPEENSSCDRVVSQPSRKDVCARRCNRTEGASGGGITAATRQG